MVRIFALALGLVTAPAAALAQAVPDRAGDAHELVLRVESEHVSSDGSSGSSSSGFALIERVVAVRDDGLELEFDLPPATPAEDRARAWEWPVRVHRAPDGTMNLLNQAELEIRIEQWLIRWDMPREACGTWTFTWTAFKIECDPRSVLTALKPFDMRLPAGAGPVFFEREAAEPTRLELKETREEGAVYVGEVALDADKFRRDRADADVIVGQITGEAVTFEAAYAQRAKEDVKGLIRTSLTVDGAVRVIRRVTTISVTVTDPAGVTENRTATETVERTPMPSSL